MDKYQIFLEAYEALCYKYNFRIKAESYEDGRWAPADVCYVEEATDKDIKDHIDDLRQSYLQTPDYSYFTTTL